MSTRLCDRCQTQQESTHFHSAGLFLCDSCDPLTCLDEDEHCGGAVEYRMALSGTGVSYARCDVHWSERLTVQEGINRRYPSHPPSDWSPYDAGESWDEDY